MEPWTPGRADRKGSSGLPGSGTAARGGPGPSLSPEPRGAQSVGWSLGGCGEQGCPGHPTWVMVTSTEPPECGLQGGRGEGCSSDWGGEAGGTKSDPVAPAGTDGTRWDPVGHSGTRWALAALLPRAAGQAQYHGPSPEPPPKPLSQRRAPLSRLCDGKSPPLLNHCPDTPIVSFPGRFETSPPPLEVRNVAGFYWDGGAGLGGGLRGHAGSAGQPENKTF